MIWRRWPSHGLLAHHYRTAGQLAVGNQRRVRRSVYTRGDYQQILVIIRVNWKFQRVASSLLMETEQEGNTCPRDESLGEYAHEKNFFLLPLALLLRDAASPQPAP